MEEVIKWFEDYKLFSSTLFKTKGEDDFKKITCLLSDFNILKLNEEIEERKIASDYNIFHVLKYVINKEEVVHSPFLADLLDVNGSHKQKRLFFNEFIVLAGLENRFDFKEDIFFSVCTEKWIGNGFIDIYIEYTFSDKRFVIAIENKIFATDQPRQLERYAQYLESEFGNDYLLVYLTPNNRLPDMPYSIEENKFYDLRKRGLIKLMTYQKDITLLLENTILGIESPKVKSIVSQYYQIVKNNFRNER